MLGIVIVVFCFVPMINMPYDVVAEKQVQEEYTTVEPYVVKEEVKEPYQSTYDDTYWTSYPAGSYEQRAGLSGHFVTEQRPITKYRTVTKDITKYREVIKIRLVKRPVV